MGCGRRKGWAGKRQRGEKPEQSVSWDGCAAVSGIDWRGLSGRRHGLIPLRNDSWDGPSPPRKAAGHRGDGTGGGCTTESLWPKLV